MEEAIDGTRRFLRELSGFGITGVIDPGGHNLDPEDYAALFRLWREHALPLRVVYSISAPRPGKELEDFQTYHALSADGHRRRLAALQRHRRMRHLGHV